MSHIAVWSLLKFRCRSLLGAMDWRMLMAQRAADVGRHAGRCGSSNSPPCTLKPLVRCVLCWETSASWLHFWVASPAADVPHSVPLTTPAPTQPLPCSSPRKLEHVTRQLPPPPPPTKPSLLLFPPATARTCLDTQRAQGPYPVAPLLPLPQYRRPDGSLFLADQDEVPGRSPPVQPLEAFQWPMSLGRLIVPLEHDMRTGSTAYWYDSSIAVSPAAQKALLGMALAWLAEVSLCGRAWPVARSADSGYSNSAGGGGRGVALVGRAGVRGIEVSCWRLPASAGIPRLLHA
jgi:hypothetical protein